MIKDEKKNKYLIAIILFVLIAIQLGRIIYVFSFEREGYHSDETFSYGFANSYFDPYIYNDANGNIKNFNVWTTSQVLRDYIEVSENEKFSYDSVYYNQKNDMSPPLHSIILHTICSFFPNTFSWNYAFLINIVSFIMAQIVLYLLAVSLTKSKWAGLLTCLFYGFTTGALNCFVYLRMYSVLTLLAILSSYLHSKMYNKQFQNICRELILIICVTIIGVMTHYYFYVFSFFITVFYCIYLSLKKQWKVIIFYAGSMLLAVVVSFAIYPYAISNMSNGASIYKHQMPYYWNFQYCLSTLITEITGIRVIFPDQVAFSIVNVILIAALVVGAALCYLFRKEKWFLKIVQAIRHSPPKISTLFVRTIKHLQWTIVFLFLVIILVLTIISRISYVLGMNALVDRYLFFLMPLLCAVMISSLYYLVRKISFRIRLQQVLLLIGVIVILIMNNYRTDCNYLFHRNYQGATIGEQTKDSNCIIVTNTVWHLTYYASLLKDTNSVFAMLTSECMKQSENLNKIDTSKPVYIIIETSKFPNEDGKLPGWESVKIVGNGNYHMGLGYTEQEFLDYLAKLNWVSQVKYISTQKGFTGSLDIYRLN